MSKHQKRQEVPKTWPVARKGTTFVVSKNSSGLPVLVALRDLMGIIQNRRELKKAIHKKDLLISSKPIMDDKRSLEVLDVLTIVPSNKHYRLTFSEHGKYAMEEVLEKEAKSKVSKIIDKKILKGNKIQLNLLDGNNYYYDKKCNVNDSVVVDFEKNTISKVLPLKEKSKVLVIAGKHIGANGTISKIMKEDKMAEIDTGKEKFNALIKQIVVLE